MIQKLKSNKGASLSFALLLFLVCAVVGGVVLAAGTAAAGRLSEIAEMDQRYYAVTSAAELFRDKLAGQTVIIERNRRVEYITEEVEDASGNPVLDEEGNPITTTVKEYQDLPPTMSVGGTAQEFGRDKSFLTDVAIDMVFGETTTSFTGQEAWNRPLGRTNDLTTPIVLNVTPSDGKYPDLKVKAEATLYKDGRIQIQFSNDNGETNVFIVQMILTPTISETNTDTVKKSSFTWELSELKKVEKE